MQEFYLFESGATKTAFVCVTSEGTSELILPGFNPNRNFDAFQIAIEEGIEIKPNSKIIFYGAGLAAQKNKNLAADLFKSKAPKSINVFDDILGAGRAALGKSAGIVSILGTGGLAAYYDGKAIIKRRGGYGYLIDDLGGGFELGKRFLSLWLNGDLSDRANAILQEKLEIDPATFTQKFYANPDLGFISSLVPYVLQFEDDEVVNILIQQYFKDFIVQQILPLTVEFNVLDFSMVGSVGFLFHQHICKVAKTYDLRVNQCIQSPILRLVEYHS